MYVIDDDIIVVGGGGDVVSILSNARFQNSRDDSDDSDWDVVVRLTMRVMCTIVPLYE